MDLGLAGKGVIVTGASRGIGRAIALGFAREGADVAICARGVPALQATRQELENLGARAFAQPCDIGDAEALYAFLDAAHAALGRVDVLVNNPSGFGRVDDEAGWDGMVSIDLMASVRATWRVVPWLETQGGGSVIHISSISGLQSGSSPPYAAIKAALISHAKSMAARLAPKNIRVNCVAPGSIEFPGGLWDRARRDDPERYRATLASIPLGRMGRPDEVADAVVYLASRRASWVSGVTLSVDGVQHKGNL